MTEKILLVDDDRNICEILEFNLKNEGYKVTCAYSAEDALRTLSADNEYALILLDVMMGGMSGYKMAEKLRNDNNRIPIIFLTAKDTENDMLTGFSVGGDDYIAKPFSIKEVLARVKAVCRRFQVCAEEVAPHRQMAFGQFVIDYDVKELIIDGNRIALTKTELEILIMLAEKAGKVFSREEILNKVWGHGSYITERTVDVHITRLRKKLGDYASCITNRSGFGYRFDQSAL